MNQPRCAVCGELEIHDEIHMCVGVPAPWYPLPPFDATVERVSLPARLCPTCGHPMPGSVPASYDASGDRGPVPAGAAAPLVGAPIADLWGADGGKYAPPAKDANVADEDAPSGYMSRDKLL